ncbi:autotransporter outer membrane beta-barrel domain-containing protein [Lentilitoribacter sp. Alg239-R112]|uniref:autotransporter outer membrane beta-barrel domain-containing protein n=1 Tax=Lentilitoribacter sp. Alg239-R112 TaxID=2305987 RepID=UPI0013A70935|nr:autotransporter outer membrane beta-barrel domain-containing protein [Lentilitoribacter sp. Alg239-R112]
MKNQKINSHRSRLFKTALLAMVSVAAVMPAIFAMAEPAATITQGTINANDVTGVDVSGTGTDDIVLDVNLAPIVANNPGVKTSAVDGDTTITISNKVIGNWGIDAKATGVGNFRIDVNADIYGTSGEGINVFADSGETIINIDDDISIKSNSGEGIRGEILANGADFTVQGNGSGTIIGTKSGIIVGSKGNILIDGIGIVGGFIENGIATNSSNGDIVITNIGDAIGGKVGISAESTGVGEIRISTQNASGGVHGIQAENSVSGTSIFIDTTGDVEGLQSGIEAFNNGSGVLIINSNNVIGQGNSGISAASSGNADKIEINTNGSIIGNEDGISISNFGQGNSTINVLGGSVLGGAIANLSDAIDIESSIGLTNTINLSTGTNITSLIDSAINAGDGNDIISNQGTIVGNVELGGGTNAFNNLSNGIFESGFNANIGIGNTLANDGLISPGGSGTITTTNVKGNFTQSAIGQLNIDLDAASATNDLLSVNGSAALDGVLRPTLINPVAQQQDFTILSATGGVTNNGFTVVNGPVTNFQLQYPNINDVVVSASVDFAIEGLNPNQTKLANHLNEALAIGGGGLTPVLSGLTELPDAASIADALDQLGGESFLNLEQVSLQSSLSFTSNLLSCLQATGAFMAISEGQCIWMQPHGRFINRDQSINNIGYSENTGGLSAGVQYSFTDNWHLGVALGYESGSLNTQANAFAEYKRYQGGAILKHQRDAWLFAAGISAGISQNNLTRNISFGGLDLAAHSKPNTSFVTSQFRAAYLTEKDGWSFKPIMDLSATHLGRDDVSETGGGAANLNVVGSKGTIWGISPSLEISRNYILENGTRVRAFADLGFSAFSDSNQDFSGSFVADPVGVNSFTAQTHSDRAIGEIDLGASIFTERGHNVSLKYQGRFSAHMSASAFQLRASLKF